MNDKRQRSLLVSLLDAFLGPQKASLPLLLLISCLLLSHNLISADLRPVTIPIPSDHRNSFANLTVINYQNSWTRQRKAHLLITDFPFSVVAGKHQKLQKTRTTTRGFNCNIAATNGGPFNPNGSNSGPTDARAVLPCTEIRLINYRYIYTCLRLYS